MKKKIVSILILSLLVAVAVADNARYYVKNIEESLAVSEPIISETDQYATVSIEKETSFLSKPGKPILPVVRKVFYLPLGSKINHVDVTFSDVKEIELSKQVRPGPEPTPKTPTQRPSKLLKDNDVYESVELYPSNEFSYAAGAGIKGDERVVLVKVDCYPVRYSPGLNTLYYSQSIDIRVSYEAPVVPVSFPELYDMVIIAPSAFSEELQPLIDHKNSRGLETILKTTEEIYSEYGGRDEPEKIKYFIKDAIETWGIEFVLLAGGAAQVPGRYTHIYFDYDYQDNWVFLSDLYYADVYDAQLNFSSWDSNENDVFAEYNWYGNTDELDLHPDVYLGRLACFVEDQVVTCVNKIIAYETSQAYAQNWFTNLVLIGGDSLPGDEEEVDEGEYVNQAVMDTLDGFIPKKVWASNGLLYDASNINAAIDSGAGFVFFNGHGNTSVWATHPHESFDWIPPGNYKISHVSALSNANQLPIVVSDACYHCTHDVAPHCFGWAFVANPDGGAIAFLGGTDIDVSYAGIDIVTKGIERLCVILSTNYKQGEATFGELWVNAIHDYLSPSMDEIDYITVEESQPFGDPSLVIAGDSQKPAKPAAPDGKTEVKVGQEQTYVSTTTDPDGDSLYYLFEWGDETYSGWVGACAPGDSASSSHQWGDQGDFDTRVIARDKNGVFSQWSDPSPICVYALRGDSDSNGEVGLVDIVYLINYLFKSGPGPYPLCEGNVDCNHGVSLTDAVYLVNYLFRGGPPPCE